MMLRNELLRRIITRVGMEQQRTRSINSHLMLLGANLQMIQID